MVRTILLENAINDVTHVTFIAMGVRKDPPNPHNLWSKFIFTSEKDSVQCTPAVNGDTVELKFEAYSDGPPGDLIESSFMQCAMGSGRFQVSQVVGLLLNVLKRDQRGLSEVSDGSWL